MCACEAMRPIHHVSGGAAVQATPRGESRTAFRILPTLLLAAASSWRFRSLLDQAIKVRRYGSQHSGRASLTFAGNRGVQPCAPHPCRLPVSIADCPGLAAALWVVDCKAGLYVGYSPPRHGCRCPGSACLVGFLARCWSHCCCCQVYAVPVVGVAAWATESSTVSKPMLISKYPVLGYLYVSLYGWSLT